MGISLNGVFARLAPLWQSAYASAQAKFITSTKGRFMTRTLLTGLAALALATPAAAHTGAHGKSVFTEIMHWLASPVHSAGTFITAAVLVAGIIYVRRRKV